VPILNEGSMAVTVTTVTGCTRCEDLDRSQHGGHAVAGGVIVTSANDCTTSTA